MTWGRYKEHSNPLMNCHYDFNIDYNEKSRINFLENEGQPRPLFVLFSFQTTFCRKTSGILLNYIFPFFEAAFRQKNCKLTLNSDHRNTRCCLPARTPRHILIPFPYHTFWFISMHLFAFVRFHLLSFFLTLPTFHKCSSSIYLYFSVLHL